MPTSKRNRAFTLMEVIVAVVIMMIAMSALLVTFRTALSAWNAGHGMSEILQTARITQEMMLRDLNNLVYENESSYNRTFRQQLDTLATDVANPNDPFGRSRLLGPVKHEGETPAGGPLTDLDAASIAMPYDLSFVGEDGGKTDRLTFARHYTPRLPTDPDTWGLRRVSYYVKDGTLYREESDPFGFRPGEVATDYYATNPALNDVVSMFMKNRPGATGAGIGEPGYVPHPLQYNVAEPLCEGVELLNVTYGYFQQYEWREVNDWDSGAVRYRNPPDESDELTQKQLQVHANDPNINRFGAIDSGTLAQIIARANRNRPDDLPGYIAVQLGVRAPGGKGRLYSFTFYYSVPMAQETDVLGGDAGIDGPRQPVSNASQSSSLRKLGGNR